MERVKSVTLEFSFSQCGVNLYLHKRNDSEQENLSF